MPGRLEQKRIIVTGASRGLGQGMAWALAEAGADIVGVGVSDSSATGDAVRGPGLMADAVAVAPDADAATKFIAQTGRTP